MITYVIRTDHHGDGQDVLPRGYRTLQEARSDVRGGGYHLIHRLKDAHGSILCEVYGTVFGDYETIHRVEVEE